MSERVFLWGWLATTAGQGTDGVGFRHCVCGMRKGVSVGGAVVWWWRIFSAEPEHPRKGRVVYAE
jgi:hypothetical protein